MPARAAEVSGPLPADEFVNPFAEGADPYLIRDGDVYWWCATWADRGVVVGRSDRPNSLGVRTVVWRAPETGPVSRQVWAPELIRLDGRWHIYFAASDGDNATHRSYVLSALSDDPQGPYELHGPLDTGDLPGHPEWSIDLTVLEWRGSRFALWSGWPPDSQEQHLYIAPMSDPWTIQAPRTLLTSPRDFAWERIDPADPEGINEGPQVVQRDGRTLVLFSCGSALLPSYKMGLLELVGSDPLDPSHWRKHPTPILASTQTTFGVGHGTLVDSPDGRETWLVYHRKIETTRNFKRVLQAQPVTWSADGFPQIGDPVEAGVGLRLPSGTPGYGAGTDRSWSFGAGSGPAVGEDFDYFGHQQFCVEDESGLRLGRRPEHAVNAFRSAEKVVVRDCRWTDARVQARFEVVEGRGTAGVLVRCTAPAVGRNAMRGYAVGWSSERRQLLLTSTDGADEEVLSRAATGGVNGPVDLVVECVGPRLRAWLRQAPAAVIEVEDARWPEGSVGLRVAAAQALFTDLSVTVLE